MEVMESTCSVLPLLGLCDAVCPSLQSSPYENKIGGYPDFLPGCILTAPPICKHCCKQLVLLVQVYCPLEGSVYHRLLHIYCCVHPSCHGKKESWHVLRSQSRDDTLAAETTPSAEERAVPADEMFRALDWCESADNWDYSAESAKGTSISSNSTTDLIEKIENLVITLPGSSEDTNLKPLEKDVCMLETGTYTGQYYPPNYLQVIEEPETNSEPELTHANILLKKYHQDNPNVDQLLFENMQSKDKKSLKGCKTKQRGKVSSLDGEGYEKATPKHGDRLFQKFQKQLSKCPQQVLRYSRGGSSLLITGSSVQCPPDPSQTVCRECGSPCLFELQLMPTLVYVLPKTINSQLIDKSHDSKHCHDDGKQLSEPHVQEKMLRQESLVEFGTVLVYTCSNSCWEDGSLPRIENVYVQMDTDKCTL